ncbi:MAG: hypothetical protein ACOC2P_01230 [Spirochaetota bacterium]
MFFLQIIGAILLQCNELCSIIILFVSLIYGDGKAYLNCSFAHLRVLGPCPVIACGQLIVRSAVRIAVQLGIPERIIALTIVSIGTLLTELATSAVAAYKKNVDIAIGF